MRALLVPLLLLAPLLTGCLSGDGDAPPAAAPVAKSAAEAGALSGEAPSAPKDAFSVAPDPAAQEKTVVAYPASIPTNPARPPVELDLSDSFEGADCRGWQLGGLDGALHAASRPRRNHDLREHLMVGDVFQYEVSLRFTNKDSAWGEIHPAFGIGSTVVVHEEPVGDEREEVVLNWTGQSYRASDDDMAWVRVMCAYGSMSEPVPYALTVRLTFADSAVPAESPILVPVPEGATRMFVRGVPFDATRGVGSHFRVFGADDRVVCECGLSSGAEVATVPVSGGDELVLLVDHTDNGFVSVAFDAPPTAPLRALDSEWVATPVLTAPGGALDQTVELDLPKVPLFMGAAVLGPSDRTPGGGKGVKLSAVNGRGEPLRVAWGGHVALMTGEDEGMWMGFWPGGWERVVDHHAFAPGLHVVTVKAEALRGEVVLITRQYVR